VPMKLMQLPMLMLYFATAEFLGWCRHIHLVFFAPCLDGPSALSYMHFSTLTWIRTQGSGCISYSVSLKCWFTRHSTTLCSC
jgi:hypothetical protein